MNRRDAQPYALKAEILKAMAHPLRLAIVEYLRDGERCVCEIAEHVGAGRSNISRHLALMVRAGVLANRKDGLQVFYSLRCRCVLNFLGCVDGVIRDRIKRATAALRPRHE